MATSSVLLLKLLKAGPVVAGRSTGGVRVLVTRAPGAPGPFEGAADPNMKDSAGSDDNIALETRGMASAAAARKVVQGADASADHVIEEAESMSEKVKQTAKDAWGSAKETAQKVKDTVVGKAEDARDFIKEKAEDGKVMIEKGKGEAKETIEKATNAKDR